MAEVTVDIAGRSYRLGCGEGEEEHLVDLATMIDGDARALHRQFGNMSEGRLLLMTALMVADRLSEAESQIYAAEQRLEKVQKTAKRRGATDDMFSAEREAELTQRVNDLIEQVEDLQHAAAG